MSNVLTAGTFVKGGLFQAPEDVRTPTLILLLLLLLFCTSAHHNPVTLSLLPLPLLLPLLFQETPEFVTPLFAPAPTPGRQVPVCGPGSLMTPRMIQQQEQAEEEGEGGKGSQVVSSNDSGSKDNYPLPGGGGGGGRQTGPASSASSRHAAVGGPKAKSLGGQRGQGGGVVPRLNLPGQGGVRQGGTGPPQTGNLQGDGNIQSGLATALNNPGNRGGDRGTDRGGQQSARQPPAGQASSSSSSSMAPPCGSLFSDPSLNENPILMEYLAQASTVRHRCSSQCLQFLLLLVHHQLVAFNIAGSRVIQFSSKSCQLFVEIETL